MGVASRRLCPDRWGAPPGRLPGSRALYITVIGDVVKENVKHDNIQKSKESVRHHYHVMKEVVGHVIGLQV